MNGFIPYFSFPLNCAWRFTCYIKDNSVSGAQIFSAMYEIDASNDKIWLDQSDDYTLTNTDIGSWVTVSFNDPITPLLD